MDTFHYLFIFLFVEIPPLMNKHKKETKQEVSGKIFSTDKQSRKLRTNQESRYKTQTEDNQNTKRMAEILRE